MYLKTTSRELALSGVDVALLVRATMDKGKQFKFKARGWSMSPFIIDGDILTLSPLSNALPHKGDVVAVSDPDTGRLFVHRVVRVNHNKYTLKGDSAKTSDTRAISLSHINGRVTRIERNQRTIRFGLGPERRAIAFLSKYRILMWVFTKIWVGWKKIVDGCWVIGDMRLFDIPLAFIQKKLFNAKRKKS